MMYQFTECSNNFFFSVLEIEPRALHMCKASALALELPSTLNLQLDNVVLGYYQDMFLVGICTNIYWIFSAQ
jgi:hypothetical protein